LQYKDLFAIGKSHDNINIKWSKNKIEKGAKAKPKAKGLQQM